MRKRARIAVFVIMILIVLAVLSPKLSGLYFEYQYRHLINYYNRNPQIQVQIDKFHNGWFSSDAILKVNINNPKIKNYFTSLGIQFPQNWIVDQHIVHGPVFFQRLDGLNTVFGLALIRNQIRIPKDISLLLNNMGINDKFIQKNEDFVNFRGQFIKHIKTNSFVLIFPKVNNLHIRFNAFEGRFLMYSSAPHISGQVMIKQIEVADDEDSISIPHIKLQFDHYQNPQKIWLGGNSLQIPEFLWTEVGGNKLIISGIHFSGNVDQTSGFISAKRVFKIEKMDWNGEIIGPFNLQLSINKINAESLSTIIKTYNDVMQRGELYQSQLQQKIISLIPNLISQGTSFNLDELNLKTPLGQLNVHGKIEWQELSDSSMYTGLVELFKIAHSSLNLSITKQLLDEFVNFAAGFSFLSQANPEVRTAYLNAKEDFVLVMKQNSYVLSKLVEEGALSKNNATNLMALQDNFVPLSDYANEVRQYLLNREISLATSYRLIWQYSEVERPYQTMQELIKTNQEEIAKDMREQIAQMQKEGYIEEKNNLLTVLLDYKKGKLTINGR